MKKSACLELLFTSEPDFLKRIALARSAGFEAIEFWRYSNKDIGAIADTVQRLNMQVTGFIVEPETNLCDPAQQPVFLDHLSKAIDVASQMRAPYLFTKSGKALEGQSVTQATASLRDCLLMSADKLENTGITLLLEPVSDSPGCLIQRSPDGLAVVQAVDRPEIRLLYDLYHASVLGEDWNDALAAVDFFGHVHVADHPGRGAPGTGALEVDAFISAVLAAGYTGCIGYEHH